MKKDGYALYFVAIIPPSPVFEEALKFKHYFKEHYNSKASLNSPPHITLHMPFRWKEEKERELGNTLLSFVKSYASFSIAFQNFNCFAPRVIYIDVAENDNLKTLQKNLQRFCKMELNIFNANYKELAYHPHITLAFRDLKKPMFHLAWEEFRDKKFNAQFTVDRMALMKHNGKMWEIFQEFKLG